MRVEKLAKWGKREKTTTLDGSRGFFLWIWAHDYSKDFGSSPDRHSERVARREVGYDKSFVFCSVRVLRASYRLLSKWEALDFQNLSLQARAKYSVPNFSCGGKHFTIMLL